MSLCFISIFKEFFNKKNEIESLEEDNRWVQDKVREAAKGAQGVEEKKL